eukprot:TRINITY_DN9584_c0_g1_i9.p1 TRINITY_DN9584_c0_g1~~TRINITY_DN9584_c0_g1_i9.p1  ORF type:complete len:345 (+),score=65.61 TRINITY_DN9584_c0_g1_i9:229-1263(+)
MNLRIILRRFYPGYIVPPLPRRAPHEFTDQVLSQYKLDLQRFLDALFSHPLFRESAILGLFVLENDHDKYEKGKKRISKANPPRNVAECYTVDGLEKVAFDPLLENKCSELSDSVDSLRNNLQKFKALDQTLIASLEHTAQTLTQLAALHEAISEDYIGLEESGMVEIFGSLSDTFSKVSDMCNELKELYTEKVGRFFRSYKDELAAIKEFMQEWKQTQHQLTKFDTQLQVKKKELFNKIPASKWEIEGNCLKPVASSGEGNNCMKMLPNEVRMLEVSKEIYGYYCNRIPAELKATWDRNKREFRDNFSVVSREYSDIFEQMLSLWNESHNYFELLKNKDLVSN